VGKVRDKEDLEFPCEAVREEKLSKYGNVSLIWIQMMMAVFP
jgi:hypothetical protein